MGRVKTVLKYCTLDQPNYRNLSIRLNCGRNSYFIFFSLLCLCPQRQLNTLQCECGVTDLCQVSSYLGFLCTPSVYSRSRGQQAYTHLQLNNIIGQLSMIVNNTLDLAWHVIMLADTPHLSYIGMTIPPPLVNDNN